MRRVAALLVCALTVAVGLTTTAFASTRYDPRLRFRTISTPRFDIHYHQGEEDQARRLAVIAEAVAKELDASLGPPSGRVQVILVAQNDLSNGWATPLPYNTIEITAAAPPADSTIGNTSDWLRMVFTHEYTHIVHLSRGRGWIGGLRRGFGRMPLLFPNIYLPVWQVEGIATYQESVSTGQGRVRDTSFRAILDVAAGTSRFDPIDRVNGGLVDWPGGNAPYLYGSFFHAYLAQKYGESTLKTLTDQTAGRIPYLGSRAFKEVFGASLGTLWRDYKESVGGNAETPSTAVKRTHHGFEVVAPRFGPDGRLYYAVVNPHGFPSLMALDPAASTPVKVRDRFLGRSFGFGGSRIVFDQIEIDNNVGLQSDLYIADLRGGRARRLTHGLRAGAPDVSPDGTSIVCTIQQTDRRALALLPLLADGTVGPPEMLLSEPGVEYDNPRWSVSPSTMVAQRGPDLVVIDVRSRTVVHRIAATGGGRLVHPFWRSGIPMVLFASDQGGRGFQLHQLEVDTGAVWRLEGSGPDARFPIESPDGDALWFVGYSNDGYDLYTFPDNEALDATSVFSNPRWKSLVNERAFRWTQSGFTTSPVGPPPAPAAPARNYSFWPTIAPRFWTPTVFTDNDEWLIGAATGSEDALGRHAYAVQAAWTTSRSRPDWQVAYAYDRWWPTLFANFSDDTDPFRTAEIRTRETNAGVLLPFRRIRWTQTLLGAAHASNDELICATCAPTEVTRRSLRTGWRISAARGYGYSISLEDGWSATTTVEFTREAWGSAGNGGAATIDLRGYVPVIPRHAVIAMRAASAATWGDASVRRVFSASGYDPQPGGFRFGSDAIGLLRGVHDDEVIGRHAAVVNLDYRLPLWRIDRGWGTVPALVRVIHGAVFADIGHAWNADFDASDAIVSIGAELSLDAVVGFRLPLTFTGGAAWVSQDRGVSVFGRIGRAF